MIVYCLHSPTLRRVKIGIATDLSQRLGQLTRHYGGLDIIRVFEGLNAKRLEAALHHHYRAERIAAPGCLEERRSGDTEWFHEAVLATILHVDPKPIMKAYSRTSLYELRLDRDDIKQLKLRGLTVEAAIKRALV